MSQAPIMPLATDALIADTTHLSAEEFGAYLLILTATWRNNGVALPNDDKRMARVCRVGVKKWQKLKPVLLQFFTLDETGWHQKRLEKEWSRAVKKVEQNRFLASLGGKAKALKDKQTALANASSQACQTHIHTHKDNPPTPNGVYPPMPEIPAKFDRRKEAKNARRGTRLEADWQLCQAGRDYALGRGFTERQIDDIAENFRDYWTAGAGRNKTHLDWNRAWQTWVRNQRAFPGGDRPGDGGVVAAVRSIIGDP